MTDEDLPPDPFGPVDPHNDQLRSAAYHLLAYLRRLRDAQQILGLDTGQVSHAIERAETLNRHFNPAVRIGHGQPRSRPCPP